MRKILSIVVLISQSFCFAQSKKVQAETSIENVTIFTSGARIERSSNVAISPGRSEITFRSLSNQLDQQSVQLQADANITLLSVQATKDFLTARKIDDQEKDFKDKINTLEEKQAIDTRQLEVLKNEEQMLIKNQAIGGQSGVKTPELKVALDFQKQRFTEVYQQELLIQKRLTEESHQLETFKLQQREISKKKDSVNYMVTALVESKESRTVKFKLLYNIKDAGWYPTYDVRLTDITQPLHISMNANVFQRSGETWKDIPLMLSSGSPNDNATPSDLQPWMLGYYDPSVSVRYNSNSGKLSGRLVNEIGEPISGATISVQRSRTATTSDANGYFTLNNFNTGETIVISAIGYQSKSLQAKTGYYSIVLNTATQNLSEVVVMGYGAKRKDAEEDAPAKTLEGRVAGMQVMQQVSVATEYQPTTTVYKINEKYTIETDGKTTTIGIKDFDVASLYEYVSIPKIDPVAFLNARIVNWQEYDLQSGEASLYFEGNYLGKTYIDLASTSDTLNLSLGKDNGIKVTRKLIKEFSTKKFIGGNRTDSRQYEITVKNTKRVPITITIKDQIPVSTVKEITVEDVKAPDAQIDKTTGIASWLITLAPGQEKKLILGFNVKYPKDRKVVLE